MVILVMWLILMESRSRLEYFVNVDGKMGKIGALKFTYYVKKSSFYGSIIIMFTIGVTGRFVVILVTWLMCVTGRKHMTKCGGLWYSCYCRDAMG
jgi:hypothetical protein